MSIPGKELVNLDQRIAQFIAPRLIAFRDTTQSYPADLPDIDAWIAELDEMIRVFEFIANRFDTPEDRRANDAALALFARRLEHLWL